MMKMVKSYLLLSTFLNGLLIVSNSQGDNTDSANITPNATDISELSQKLSYTQFFSNGTKVQFTLDESDIMDMLLANVSSESSDDLPPDFADEEVDKEDSEIPDLESLRRLVITDPDGRYQISSSYASTTPYQQIGMVAYKKTSTSSWEYCTGTLIGNRHVLTAASCIYTPPEVIPGRRLAGYTIAGYSHYSVWFCPSMVSSTCSTGWYWLSTGYVPDGWSSDGDAEYDFGLIVLGNYPNKGYLTFSYSTGITTSSPWWFRAIGYPSDKTFGTMWDTECYMASVGTYSLYDTSCDFDGSQTGSALYSWATGSRVIYGVSLGSTYCYGSTLCPDADTSDLFIMCDCNEHVRFTSTSYSLLTGWISANP